MNTRGVSILTNGSARPKASPGPDYYKLLARRLETLLDDMERAGTPPDDDLMRRLRVLLEEARAQLRGRG